MSRKSQLKSKAISAKKLLQMLDEDVWIVDQALMHEYAVTGLSISEKIYSHKDGRILDTFADRYDGGGRLYSSREAYMQMLEKVKAAKVPHAQHVLMDRFPYGQDFPDHVDGLIEKLPNLIKVPEAQLDLTLPSLQVLDKHALALGAEQCLEVPIFPAIMAYVGEVMRRAIDGKWFMKLSQFDQKTWEPWILDTENRVCNTFIIVYDQLAEHHIPSIYSF